MTPTTQANIAWLRDYSRHYKNRWVALRNGHLVCFSETKEKLMERLGNDTERIGTYWIPDSAPEANADLAIYGEGDGQ